MANAFMAVEKNYRGLAWALTYSIESLLVDIRYRRRADIALDPTEGEFIDEVVAIMDAWIRFQRVAIGQAVRDDDLNLMLSEGQTLLCMTRLMAQGVTSSIHVNFPGLAIDPDRAKQILMGPIAIPVEIEGHFQEMLKVLRESS